MSGSPIRAALNRTAVEPKFEMSSDLYTRIAQLLRTTAPVEYLERFLASYDTLRPLVSPDHQTTQGMAPYRTGVTGNFGDISNNYATRGINIDMHNDALAFVLSIWAVFERCASPRDSTALSYLFDRRAALVCEPAQYLLDIYYKFTTDSEVSEDPSAQTAAEFHRSAFLFSFVLRLNLSDLAKEDLAHKQLEVKRALEKRETRLLRTKRSIMETFVLTSIQDLLVTIREDSVLSTEITLNGWTGQMENILRLLGNDFSTDGRTQKERANGLLRALVRSLDGTFNPVESTHTNSADERFPEDLFDIVSWSSSHTKVYLDALSLLLEKEIAFPTGLLSWLLYEIHCVHKLLKHAFEIFETDTGPSKMFPQWTKDLFALSEQFLQLFESSGIPELGSGPGFALKYFEWINGLETFDVVKDQIDLRSSKTGMCVSDDR